MTKDEAQREATRRWRALPIMSRQTFEQADAFASTIADQVSFHTMGNVQRMIASWLIRDIVRTEELAASARLPTAAE